MALQQLPIGEQNFEKIRKAGMLYVDKTELISNLIQQSNYCFLSRPRRFGKSLTLSTMQAMFEGRRELFEGLWAEKNWDWGHKNPVIHLVFNRIGYSEVGLSVALVNFFTEQSERFGTPLNSTTPGQMMVELIRKVSAKHGKVVLLVDEYDKPIIDFLDKDKLHIAKEHRSILKGFYSGLKDSESQAALRFLLITGVSKFSQVSIFSDLNYLDDITLDRNTSTLVGYTQADLEHYFKDWLQEMLDLGLAENREDLLANIKRWYDGYTWDSVNHLYNPFSVLNFLKKASFGDYWFKSGTPTFLLDKIREYDAFQFNNLKVSKRLFDSYDLENLELRSLLFQTGYLTIKHIDHKLGIYTLDYPNREVEEAMHDYLIGTLLQRAPSDSAYPVVQLMEAFGNRDIQRAVTIINAMLKDVPSLLLDQKGEHFYHALVHLLFRYLGLYMDSEVHTSDGRLDALVRTATDLYILEFKVDQSAQHALDQIIKKRYADKFRSEGKPITGIGINFGSGRKDVEGWIAQEL